MSNVETWKKELRGLKADIRVEVVLAGLLQDGAGVDKILVQATGWGKRTYRREIDTIEEEEQGPWKNKKTVFYIHRGGLYDQLPEDLFHAFPATDRQRDDTDMARVSRRQKEIENGIRQFFQPLDNEFYLQRVVLELEERKFLFETNGEAGTELLDQLWDLPSFLSARQKSRWGIVLPQVYRWQGDRAIAAYVLSTVTGNKVAIHPRPPASCYLDEGPLLAECRLGEDLVLGGIVTALQEGITVRVDVEGVKMLPAYLPGGSRHLLYAYLCQYLLPFEPELYFEWRLPPKAEVFMLEGPETPAALLGYTTRV